MKIGDRVFVHGYIDEIRKDTVIIRNDGGYFGTIPNEIITGELPPVSDDGDTIYRQAAIEAMRTCYDTELKEFENGDEFISYDQAVRELESLPPASNSEIPNSSGNHSADSDKMVDGDLIYRQAAEKALGDIMPRLMSPDGTHPADEKIFAAQEMCVDCIEVIHNLPSVSSDGRIRCKDCRYYKDMRCYETHSLNDLRKSNDFCSKAESYQPKEDT